MGGIMQAIEFLKNPDRDYVSFRLKEDRIPTNQVLHWMTNNVSIDILAFIDGHVKYNWPLDYFYELCAYSIKGDENYGSPA